MNKGQQGLDDYKATDRGSRTSSFLPPCDAQLHPPHPDATGWLPPSPTVSQAAPHPFSSAPRPDLSLPWSQSTRALSNHQAPRSTTAPGENGEDKAH